MGLLAFLIDQLFFFLVAAALLRGWMNIARLRMTQQPGRFVIALTNWIVVPLRRGLPKSLSQSRIDWGSLIAAALLCLLHALLQLLLSGALAAGAGSLVALPGLALLFALRTALQGLIALVLAYAILSWVQPSSSALELLARLAEPLLAPIRRIVPQVGGVDLSALLLLLALQLALLALG